MSFALLHKQKNTFCFISAKSKLQFLLILFVPDRPSGPPVIVPVGRSKILDNVKRFLPELAAAEVDLKKRLESGENLDIEECEGKSDSASKFTFL